MRVKLWNNPTFALVTHQMICAEWEKKKQMHFNIEKSKRLKNYIFIYALPINTLHAHTHTQLQPFWHNNKRIYLTSQQILKKLIALKCFSHKLTMRINLRFNYKMCVYCLHTYNTECCLIIIIIMSRHRYKNGRVLNSTKTLLNTASMKIAQWRCSCV